MSEALFHYIVVRRDLPAGDICAQVAHAAGESFYKLRPSSSDAERSVSNGEAGASQAPSGSTFDPSRTVVVVLGSRNEGRLQRLEQQLVEKQVAHVSIRETDGPWNGQLMAVGLVPGLKHERCPHVREFQMLRFTLETACGDLVRMK